MSWQTSYWQTAAKWDQALVSFGIRLQDSDKHRWGLHATYAIQAVQVLSVTNK